MILALAALLLTAGLASAAPINLVSYATTGPNLVDFETFPPTPFGSANDDGIVSAGGVTIGERFAGQTATGSIDLLSGNPSNPLILLPGPSGDNLAIGDSSGVSGWGNTSLFPCGTAGCTTSSGFGEGSFAVLFPGPVSEFGFQASFSSSGDADTFVDVFRADGSLIDSLIVSTDGGLAPDSFGFRREASVQDILGFSVHTGDPDGLGYDNIRYGVVPEPATSLLVGLGLIGLAVRRR